MKVCSIHSTCRSLASVIALTLAAGIAAAQDHPTEEKSTTTNLPQYQLNYAIRSLVSQVEGTDNHPLLVAAGIDPLIGIETAPADKVLRIHLGLAKDQGLIVKNVVDNCPAALAGVQVDDVLIATNDEAITDAVRLHQTLTAAIDKPVKFAYIRAGKRDTVVLTPGKKATPAKADVQNGIAALAPGVPKYWIGVTLANADSTLRSHLNIAEGVGLVVTGVEKESPASRAGVIADDLLIKLDGKELKSTEELSEQLQKFADTAVPLDILRAGHPVVITVTPAKRPDSAYLRVDVGSPDTRFIYWTVPLTNQLVTSNAEITAFGIANQALIQPLQPAADQQHWESELSDLLKQTRQLEASLEALKSSLHTHRKPAPEEVKTPAETKTPVTPAKDKPE